MGIEDRQKLFENPSKEYRGKPFWAWNGKLTEEELLRQIDIFEQMGFGGFFMHSRTGLETEYLGEEWFRLTRRCADYAAEKGMEAWLYDEDRWPSGSAGGMATQQPEYRASFLEMKRYTPEEWMDAQLSMEQNPCKKEGDFAAEEEPAVFAVVFQDGDMQKVRPLKPGEPLENGETAVVFTVVPAACSDNYNGYTYLDTMNRKAVGHYMQLTHERYASECGSRLGKSIPGIFTDEPHRGPLFSEFSGGKETAVPYTPSLFPEYKKRFGYSLKEKLPELFFRYTGEELSGTARDYMELCQELFLENFAQPIQDWCSANKLLFTGHVLHEDSLTAQTVMQGSLMRFYEYMDYPGVDVLTEKNDNWWIVKQIASVARQLGKKGILSELYGCTGWQMDLEDYKQVGDWQALFGINLRCPHLSWYTMKGEAKRDYPASIFFQSAWYPEYRKLEDYFSRIHALLSDTEPVCGVLVLNPIESVWARSRCGAFRGLEAVGEGIIRLEERYRDTFRILISSHIDFDYGEEDIMARHGSVRDGMLNVGRSAYHTVLVTGMETMRSSTLELLAKFREQGGRLVFAGEVPGYVDVLPTDKVRSLAEKAVRIPFEEARITECCSDGKISITGKRASRVAVQCRKAGKETYLFLLNLDRDHAAGRLVLSLEEEGWPELWDAKTGKIWACRFRKKGGRLEIPLSFAAGEEKLLVIAGRDRACPIPEPHVWERVDGLPEEYDYRLSEENVCVLDKVRITTQDGTMLPRQEVLKADRALRDTLGIPWRGGEMLQPWYEEKKNGIPEKPLKEVVLEYRFEAETVPEECFLALEDREHVTGLSLGDREIPVQSAGKWLDSCFDRIALPSGCVKKGVNVIKITYAYYKTGGIEAVYLLGRFGVRLADGGKKAVLTGLPPRLKAGDIGNQGLPFYSGRIRLKLPDLGKGLYRIRMAGTHAACIRVLGKEEALMIQAPYEAEVEEPEAVELVFGRRNTFGPLHEWPAVASAYGPGNFMTEGKAWRDSYVRIRQGILKAPVLWKERTGRPDVSEPLSKER